MLQNNTINRFQHFPFYLVDPSTKFIHTSPILFSNVSKTSDINLDSPKASPANPSSPLPTPISTPAPNEATTSNSLEAKTTVVEDLISSSNSLQQTSVS